MNSFTPFALKWEKDNILKINAYKEINEQQCRHLEKHTKISTIKTLNTPKFQTQLDTNNSNQKKVRFQIQKTEALPERSQQISTQTSVSANSEKYKESLITSSCVIQTYENKHQLNSKKSNLKIVRFQALSERTQQISSATSKSAGVISPCSKKCSLLCKKTLKMSYENKARSQIQATETVAKTSAQQISSTTNSITTSSDKSSLIYKKSANTPTDISCSFNKFNSQSTKIKVDFNRVELLYYLLTMHRQQKESVQLQRFGSTRLQC